jgi:WD40 repeat protein
VKTGHELRTLQGHSGCVRGVAVSGDRRLAVSASDDWTLKVWEVESGRELRTLEGHRREVYSVAVTRTVGSPSLPPGTKPLRSEMWGPGH